jgi:hypothetical protein
MRLSNITAAPHPSGNRIDLKWINPDPDQYPGVRVVRRKGTHPTSPEGGVMVVEGEQLNAAVDKDLKGETVYCYTLFPYKGDPPKYYFDNHNRVSAMATSPYNMAGQMYNLLPGIYHRYDTKLPLEKFHDRMLEEDQEKGQLRRFLDLPGSQLDQFYSFARAMLDLYNLDKVDGHLLRLLAEWIGWQTDYRLEIAAQRNEIRNAPYVYKTIGLIPTVEATVKRLIGWESRTKEFVHNVFLSNSPERLNIWACQRNGAGEWSKPAEPLSLDFAYEGKPAAVCDVDGTLWLFYHTYKKRYDTEKKKWRTTWDIWFKTFSEDRGWTSSQPLTNRTSIDKHPTVVIQGEKLWIFWSAYDEKNRMWCINYRTRAKGEWSGIEIFSGTDIERNKPWAVVDNTGGLWLFWMEKEGNRWQLKYNRHNGSAWELEPAVSFPLDAGGEYPRVENDLFVLFHPTDLNQRIWVFWARKESAGGPDQTRWAVAYRVKQGIDPNASDWSEIRTLPKDIPEHQDREPAAIVNGAGNIELFWSSDRDGSWSIWRNTLDIVAHNWETAEQATHTPYSQRTPLPAAIDDGTLLIYHSNESLTYVSTIYGATETLDSRYAGSTTIDTRNAAKIGMRSQFEDFQTYIYDVGRNGKRTDQDWYARDTVGIYLTPDTEDQTLILRNQKLIENALRQFLPIQVRAVFIIEPAVYEELIYTYDFPTAEPQRLIAEQFFDRMDSTTSEIYSGLGDSYQDAVPGWIWLCSWSEEYPDHRTINFTTIPIDTKFRTWHIGLEAGV